MNGNQCNGCAYEEQHTCGMRTDTERLDWVIKNKAYPSRLEGEGRATNWFIMGPEYLDHLRGTFETPREAIDAAMDQECGK